MVGCAQMFGPSPERSNRKRNQSRLASAVAAAWLLGAIFVGGAGCSGSKAVNTCVPGASPTCGCPDGQTGAQVCTSAGTYGPCVCAGAGGDAGTVTGGPDGFTAPAGTDAKIFTPPIDTTHTSGPIPLVIDSLPTKTRTNSDETYYVVHVTLANSVTAQTRFGIAGCSASVQHDGSVMVPDAPLRSLQGPLACRPAATQVDLGLLFVGTTEQSGTMTFTVSMFDVNDMLIVQGSVSTTVWGDMVVNLELVAAQVAH